MRIAVSDLAYFAGVFDSDGSFSVHKRQRKMRKSAHDYRVVLQLTWKDMPQTRMVMTVMKDLYGGSLCVVNNKGFPSKSTFIKWGLYSKQAIPFLHGILPYLKVKREQAELCYQFAMTVWKGGPRPTEREWKRREQIYRQVRAINAQGKGGRRVMIRQ